MVNANWSTDVADEAGSVISVSASASHVGGQIGINPGELMLFIIDLRVVVNIPILRKNDRS